MAIPPPPPQPTRFESPLRHKEASSPNLVHCCLQKGHRMHAWNTATHHKNHSGLGFAQPSPPGQGMAEWQLLQGQSALPCIAEARTGVMPREAANRGSKVKCCGSVVSLQSSDRFICGPSIASAWPPFFPTPLMKCYPKQPHHTNHGCRAGSIVVQLCSCTHMGFGQDKLPLVWSGCLVEVQVEHPAREPLSVPLNSDHPGLLVLAPSLLCPICGSSQGIA